MDQPLKQSPEPRYYDARRSRRSFLFGGAAVLVGGAGAVAALRSNLFVSADEPVRGQIVGLADLEVAPGQPDVDPADEGSTGDFGFGTVGMVGDSITAGSMDELRYVFTAHGVDEATIDGVPSRRIEIGNGNSEPLNGISTLYAMLADGVRPDAWVIALGTNDVGQYADATEYAGLIDTMVEMLPDDVALVWVDVYRPRYLEDTETFNRLVRERLARRDRSAVASWFDVASRPDQQVLQDDGIHPNDDGSAAFAGLVAAALATLA